MLAANANLVWVPLKWSRRQDIDVARMSLTVIPERDIDQSSIWNGIAA